MKISPSRNSGCPICCATSFCCSATSVSETLIRFSTTWRNICDHASCALIWSISVRVLTPSDDSFARSAPGCRLLRVSISLIAAAIWASWMTILRRCASCTRSRSSTSCRRICGRSRSITSGDSGNPVEIANSRARLAISASLMTSPLTTAAIRLPPVSGSSAGGAACVRLPPAAPNATAGSANGSSSAPARQERDRIPRRRLGISGTPEFIARDSRTGRSS